MIEEVLEKTKLQEQVIIQKYISPGIFGQTNRNINSIFYTDLKIEFIIQEEKL